MNQPLFHHEKMSQGLCCRCLEAILKQNKTHSSMWDPDGHTLSFRSSWWRLDVEVVGFFWWQKNLMGILETTALQLKKFTPLKTESHDVSMGLVYIFTYMKAMKINDSCRYTILWIVWDCLPPPKKKEKYSRHSPEKKWFVLTLS